MRAAALGMSDRSVRRILHDDLHFHPYKLAVVQEFTERDFAARQHACEAFLETLPDDALVFFSDEAHFYLSGCVNKQNWSDNYPRELNEKPLHCEGVTVWCALSRVGIIGPYFFEENEVAVTVNSDRYVNMIEDFLFAKSCRNGYWGCVVSAGWSHGTHGANCNACFVGTLPRAPDLFQGRYSVAGALTRYSPL
jgi:hypothetical protein